MLEPGYYARRGRYRGGGVLDAGHMTAGPFKTALEAVGGLEARPSSWVATIRVNRRGMIIPIVITHIDMDGTERTKVVNHKELKRARKHAVER